MPYEEPTGHARAGAMIYKGVKSPWELFVDDEGIPVYKGVGVRDSRELPRTQWDRLGGLGTYIELSGLQNRTALYVIEIPPGKSLNPERHLYEERMLVLEGRGSTEIWTDANPEPMAFEWAQWSVFSPPMNTWHRIINSSSQPALILAASSAPQVINAFEELDFIFNTPRDFTSRYQPGADYFKPQDEFSARPGRGSAQLRSNVIHDSATSYLPLDNGRGPGYRTYKPVMSGNTAIDGFIAEYPSGRYSKAHFHTSGAVLVCLRGYGYSFTWPTSLGTQPWAAGKGESVLRQDYVPGGMVSAAPGGNDWFHQHFAISEGPFRVFNFTGAVRSIRPGRGVDDAEAAGPAEIGEGGSALPYYQEDPFVREYYKKRLAEEGAPFEMPEEVYAGPTDYDIGFS